MAATREGDKTGLGGSSSIPDAQVHDAETWTFCWEHLVAVSRTFSQPIAMLEGELQVATTCGYLLCRIADTIEDHPQLDYKTRRTLFELFLEVVEEGATGDEFARACERVDGTGVEWRLARNIDRVMSVYREDLGEDSRTTCTAWIGEMVRGMDIYARRQPDSDGYVQLHTISDLERYCYFVAGTVGRMLTGLFTQALDEDLSHEDRRSLHTHAESFGLGLQLVNILKDQTDDLKRGWSFIPSTVWQEMDKPRSALEKDDFDDAHAAIEPVFDRAREHLDRALEYVLALPSDAVPVRLFCLLPLWMAARTLSYARGHDDLFVGDRDVKISREEVHSLIADCSQKVQDDQALRVTYATLWN